MNFLKKISSLKKKALYHVALNLCQDDSFKEVAMCLETPTHGSIILDQLHLSTHFISAPEMLVRTKIRKAKIKGDDDLANTLSNSLYSNPQNKAELWDLAVEEECQRLTEGFPSSFKQELHVWINRLALEYLCYSRRQETLFGVSRYFFMNILTLDDWTEAGRLNEMKIAKRLLRDKRLTNVQKYCITCVYSFHRSIPLWWSKLTHEEKQSLSENDDPHHEENGSLISLWCTYMNLHEKKELAWHKRFLWMSGANVAVRYGNKTALMFFWKKIRQSDRHWLVTDLALKALQEWKFAEILGIDRKKLFSNDYCSPCKAPDLNLPHYYTELLHFFLSEMYETELVRFFEKAFEKEDEESECITSLICVLECFLDWPLQDYFLSTINLLWGTIPMDKYGKCLFLLACKHSGKLKRYYSSTSLYAKIHFYDYESMLWKLWKATPDDYKNYVFYDAKEGSDNYSSTMISQVLFQLLEKDPLENRDVALFKRVWLDLPQEIRRAMIEVREPEMRFSYGDDICSVVLLEKERWLLANWLLEGNFPNEEIPNYKKQLIESRGSYCFAKLLENCFKFVEDLMNWCLLTDTEKMKFKCELFTDHDCGLAFCSHFLTKGEFTKVEKMIDFCLSSDHMKEEFKVECGESACRFLVDDCEWELMDKILTWCNKPEKEIQDFKMSLFFCLGLDAHYRLLFVQEDWENVESFYKWFCLSPEEIIKIKKQTVLMPQIIKKVHEALYEDDIDEIEPCLRWCLTNEEIVINFKEKVEKRYFNKVLSEKNDKKAKKFLDYLVSRFLYRLKKEVVCNITNREDTSMKNKDEKRFLVIEDESNSAKRLRHKT